MLRLLALLTLLLLPAAAAQEAPRVALAAGDAGGPIKPLEETREVPLTVTVSCALLVGAPGSSVVNLAVLTAPPWLAAAIEPSTVALAPTACSGLDATAEARLILSTTADAPAFSPVNLSVGAWLDHPTGNKSAAVDVPAQAAYFGILAANATTTQAEAKPQSVVQFEVTVANHGNGATKLLFTADGAPDGWQVVAPAPVALEAAQAGGTLTSQRVLLSVQTPAGFGNWNEVQAFTLRIAPAYALDPALKGDEAELSFLVTVSGFSAPGVAWAAATAALAVAGLALRGRRQ